MPSNGSAGPTVIDNEPGRVATLVFPINGSNLIWGIENKGMGYTIKTIPQTGGNLTTLVTDTNNEGTFIATASTVYYTTWTGATDSGRLLYSPGDELYTYRENLALNTRLSTFFRNDMYYKKSISDGNSPFLFDT